MSGFPEFAGNCPHAVAKDAKYCVRHGANGPVVALMYRTGDDERWHLSTEAHPELVERVNAVKVAYNGSPGGPFYINEFQQVIVPHANSSSYYLAGTYEGKLRFEFEGKTISGEPNDFDGRRLRPGDTWVGPHAGIPYVLTAGGDDIYYRTWPRPDVEKRVKLSATRGQATAQQMARLLASLKGPGGGRFYVNEFRSVFSPINGVDGLEYRYFGQIDLGSWFLPVAAGELAPA